MVAWGRGGEPHRGQPLCFWRPPAAAFVVPTTGLVGWWALRLLAPTLRPLAPTRSRVPAAASAVSLARFSLPAAACASVLRVGGCFGPVGLAVSHQLFACSQSGASSSRQQGAWAGEHPAIDTARQGAAGRRPPPLVQPLEPPGRPGAASCQRLHVAAACSQAPPTPEEGGLVMTPNPLGRWAWESLARRAKQARKRNRHVGWCYMPRSTRCLAFAARWQLAAVRHAPPHCPCGRCACLRPPPHQTRWRVGAPARVPLAGRRARGGAKKSSGSQAKGLSSMGLEPMTSGL
jgi:hypothetical protein